MPHTYLAPSVNTPMNLPFCGPPLCLFDGMFDGMFDGIPLALRRPPRNVLNPIMEQVHVGMRTGGGQCEELGGVWCPATDEREEKPQQGAQGQGTGAEGWGIGDRDRGLGSSHSLVGGTRTA